MTLTSLAWLAVMIATIGVYWLLPAKWRSSFLVFTCAGLLAAIDVLSLAFLVTFTIASFYFSHNSKFAKTQIAIAIISVIGVVAYYKLRVADSPVDVLRDVAMPIGMSYYSFRVIHYLIDRYRGTTPKHNFREYVAYLFFVPTILVGPIHRFPTFVADHSNITWNASDLSEGIERILIGYFKIVVLGNFLLSSYFTGQIATLYDSHAPLYFYLDTARGALNLYILFAGYSDVAIGFALMIGYRVMENFNNPFLSTNIAEFWRRWHISLTSWSRDYVYMPVVGFTRSPYVGTLASLMVIGIWHELSLRYIMWGIYHGIGIIFVNKLQQILRNRRRRKKIMTPPKNDTMLIKAVKIFLTSNYVFFGYVIISQDTLIEALRVYQTILLAWVQ